MYEVDFHDGEIQFYAANDIAENIWSHVDPEGQPYIIFKLYRTTAGVKFSVLC